jgi:hypothetical protein
VIVRAGLLVLVGGGVLALGSSPSFAGPTVHKDVLGSWCYVGTVVKGEAQYGEKFDKDCDTPSDILIIQPTRYEGWEYGCRFTAVKTWFDPNIIASTKTMGVKVSRIESSCEGIDCTWKEQLTVYVEKGTLIIKNVRQGRRAGRGC